MARQEYLCPMRWSDMDAQGHINNSAFFVYLEQARIEVFFERAVNFGVTEIARGVVVARHEIDYRKPVVYRAKPLAIQLWCSHLGGASFTVDYEIFDDGVLAVQARSKCVTYDLAAGRARRLTPVERSFVESLFDEVN